MKRVLSLFLVLLMICSCSGATESAVTVQLDGNPVIFDTEPIVQNGTTLVPMRAIFEALGASVEWNNSTKTVTSVLHETTVSLTIDSKVAYKNGVKVSLLTAPVIVEGRTLVPVRFISESFGLDVSWDQKTGTVFIRSEETDWLSDKINELGFDAHQLLQVDGGDLSGNRKAKVKVDVGFGEREYWAFTNEYSQLVAVIAEQIILQDDQKEPVNENGRYYPDEAKVPGTEAFDLDEGHVIGDSLGGVSNAYNITPQESTLNRHGDQAYMEEMIRKAGGCSHFVAVITYPNTKTQTPDHYQYSYFLQGNQIYDDFDNVNPEKVKSTENDEKTEGNSPKKRINVFISEVDKRAEYVVIKNGEDKDVNISGWELVSETGNQRFLFPEETMIKTGKTLKITSGNLAGTGDFTMAEGNVWNNSGSDPAVLYDENHKEIDRY